MHRYFHVIRKAGFFGSIMLGFVTSGCGGGGLESTVRQQSSSDHPGIPQITAERLQECVKEYGNQLEGGSWAFNPTIQVNRDGYVVDVNAGEIPDTASDLAACTRIAWRDMAIPSYIFNIRPTQSDTTTNEPTIAQRAYVGSPAVVVVVVVGLSEIVLEAGATTILFAVTVKVVDKAVDDVAEAVKRWRPKPNKNRCLDAAASGEYLWEEFCRSMKNPGNCWSKTYESEQNKRGWCHEKFGS